MLLQLTTMLNNFIKYNSTHLAFIEIFYKFKVKESLNMLKHDNFNFEDLTKKALNEIKLAS